MRFSICLIFLFWSVGSAFAEEKLVAKFKSVKNEQIEIVQKGKGYGLDLLIKRSDLGSGEIKTKKVRNAFGVVLDGSANIFMCWIANGHFFPESFQIFNIEKFQGRVLKLDSSLIKSDEIECLIEEKERYFLVFDSFLDDSVMYIFDKSGKQVKVIKGALSKKIEIEGNVYHFVGGHVFGGFVSGNVYIR